MTANINIETTLKNAIPVDTIPPIEQNVTRQVVADRAQFAQALAIVEKAISGRRSYAFNESVMIKEKFGGLELITDDSDIEARVNLFACADDGFNAAIPAKTLLNMLKKSRKSETIALSYEQDGETCELDTENTKYNLQTSDVSEFPEMSKAESTNTFRVDGNVFWQALDRVKGAISKDEVRYYLEGIYMHEYNDQLRMVSTDGHRLYCQDCGEYEGTTNMPGVIIPRKAIEFVHGLTRVLKLRPETFEIEVCETQIVISWDNVSIRSKTIDGTFPDYHRVIPYNDLCEVKADSVQLSEAIADVSLVSSEKGRAVKFTFDHAGINVSVNNPEKGTAQSDLAATVAMPTDQEKFEIGFNSQYFVEAMGIFKSGTVQLEMNTEADPVRITGDLEGFQAVIMPMWV